MAKSISFNELANIGIHAPIGAVSFHTYRGKIIYLIGATGKFEEKPLPDDAAERLEKLYKMTGTFGWGITGI